MSLISLAQAVQTLKSGGTVAVPTETVYGLAGRIDREETLKKIFAVKSRPFFDPLIVHVEDVRQAREQCASWPAVYDVLATEFWPGPLTLIADKAAHISSLITSGLATVAVRSPRHALAQELLRQVGVPLAAPSANRFGRTSPTAARHVEDEFDGEVEVLDGGVCEVGLESTVVQAQCASSGQWELQILRPGGVSRAQLEAVLQRAGYEFQISRQSTNASPGHLKHHYQPNCPVVILRNQKWNTQIQQTVEAHFKKRFSFIYPLRFTTSAQEAARRLYEEFRSAAKNPGALIVVERTSAQESEEWDAIWDRIERASSLIL